MPAHHFGEAELALPHGWADQSVTSYILPRPGGDGFLTTGGQAALVITRDYESVRTIPATEDFLDRYADRQLAEAGRRLAQYEPLGRAPGTVGGRRALVVDAAWTLPTEQRVRQRQAFVRLGDRVLIFTLTALEDEFEAYGSVWADATGGVRWRPGAGLPAFVSRPAAPPGGAPGAAPSA